MNAGSKATTRPLAIFAVEAPPRVRASNYPEAFAGRVAGREKRPLGDLFGLRSFGVNLTRLAPGAMSALRHAHSRQDEFVYILSGYPTLVTDEGPSLLEPGMCAGFAAGSGNAHHLVNRSDDEVVYVEIGDRSMDDVVSYPDDDIEAIRDATGNCRFARKSGAPY